MENMDLHAARLVNTVQPMKRGIAFNEAPGACLTAWTATMTK